MKNFRKQIGKAAILAAVLFVGAAQSQCAHAVDRFYYVSEAGTGNQNGTSEANSAKWFAVRNTILALPTTDKAIVTFAPGFYNRTELGGGADGMIDVPARTVLQAKNSAISTGNQSLRTVLQTTTNQAQNHFFVINGQSDITISGFEMDGSPTISDTTKFTNGIFAKESCYRITFTNNIIHDCGGGGIATYNSNVGPNRTPGRIGGADFITIDNNEIYNCCYWLKSNGGASAISLLGTSNTKLGTENSLTIHNFISRNKLHDNKQLFTDANRTDGNGIIIDLCGGNTTDPLNKYPARTLIENNIIYRNGGRGIHVLESSNVLARNNTCFTNLTNPDFTTQGELSAQKARDVLFANNVIYRDNVNYAFNVIQGSYASSIVFRSNSYGYGGVNLQAGTVSTDNIAGVLYADFFNPGANPPNLRNVVRSGTNSSPYSSSNPNGQKIIDTGSSATSGIPNNNDYATRDILGNQRTSGSVDRGAYETSFASAPRPAAQRSVSQG